jgi:hypothetical protein
LRWKCAPCVDKTSWEEGGSLLKGSGPREGRRLAAVGPAFGSKGETGGEELGGQEAAAADAP